MDPFFLLVFTFVLLLVLLVGGFVLLFPLTRRLGTYLERLLEEEGPGRRQPPAALREVRAELKELRTAVHRLTEQQAFVESLLEERDAAPRVEGESEGRGDAR